MGKPRRIVHNGPEYQRRLITLAHSALNIVDCKFCGSPRQDGFLCWHCHLDNSFSTYEEAVANANR